MHLEVRECIISLYNRLQPRLELFRPVCLKQLTVHVNIENGTTNVILLTVQKETLNRTCECVLSQTVKFIVFQMVEFMRSQCASAVDVAFLDRIAELIRYTIFDIASIIGNCTVSHMEYSIDSIFAEFQINTAMVKPTNVGTINSLARATEV